MSSALQFLLACAAYAALAALGFRFLIGPLYRRLGRLPPAGALHQPLLFAGVPIIGLLALRDARIGIVAVAVPLLVIGLSPGAAGVGILAAAMISFRSAATSFGLDARRLHTQGV
ncbi:MAG: hypothetical protein GF330_12235 [Candidatus Eisenbacteria bacterium]|nr:hypothetical protein [Candidatus Eisenbacteria bacterium]